MLSNLISAVVFDMSGTTLTDFGEVEDCFYQAITDSGLQVSRERINSMMGWSKIRVFETIWKEELDPDHPELTEKVQSSFARFREILEGYYHTERVELSPGTAETWEWLRREGVQIVLTTGFYREVADIILDRLNILEELDESYRNKGNAMIDLSITSDQVEQGRPAPDMIHKAMMMLKINDPVRVIKIGDTPSDLEAGRRASCYMSLAITNGSHTHEQLDACDHDGLIESMKELQPFLVRNFNISK